MQTFPRKRLEIVVDRAIVPMVTGLFDEAGVGGYTRVAVEAGRGEAGNWADDQITGEQKVVFIAITTETIADKLIAKLAQLFETYPGVVILSDCQVLRPGKF